jgi:hypothetical protein
VGVDLEPLFAESYSLQERLHNGRWQIALVAYSLSPDPDQRALWTTPTNLVGDDLNITGYHNDTIASLLTEAASLPGCDLEARADLYHTAWAQLITDRPFWPLFMLPVDIVQRPGTVTLDTAIPASSSD